jgi:hypothetical protein
VRTRHFVTSSLLTPLQTAPSKTRPVASGSRTTPRLSQEGRFSSSAAGSVEPLPALQWKIGNIAPVPLGSSLLMNDKLHQNLVAPSVAQIPEEPTDNWDDDFEEGISFTKIHGELGGLYTFPSILTIS